jgi:copper chaperone
MQVTFNVPSVSCSICSDKIKAELLGKPGIEGIDIDLKSQAVKVAYNPERQQPDDIRSAIAEMGYEVY